MIPRNEAEFLIYFAQNCVTFGFDIVSYFPAGYPDAILVNLKNGEEFSAEFEYESNSFIEHGHDPRRCDMIICWKNNLPLSPGIPVWELTSSAYPETFEINQRELDVFVAYIAGYSRKRDMLRASPNKYGTDWRNLRPDLNDDDLKVMSELSPEKMASMAERYNVSYKTVSNWRANARKELGK